MSQSPSWEPRRPSRREAGSQGCPHCPELREQAAKAQKIFLTSIGARHSDWHNSFTCLGHVYVECHPSAVGKVRTWDPATCDHNCAFLGQFPPDKVFRPTNVSESNWDNFFSATSMFLPCLCPLLRSVALAARRNVLLEIDKPGGLIDLMIILTT